MPGTESLRTVLLRMAELSISPQPEQTTQREEAHINDSVVLLLLEMLQERFGLCRTRLDVALVRRRVADSTGGVLRGGLDDLAVLNNLIDLEDGEGHGDGHEH